MPLTPDSLHSAHWFQQASDADLRGFVAQFARSPEGHGPDVVDPMTRQWRYVPALPLEEVCWPDEWRTWFLLEGEPERYQELMEHWDSQILTLPIIAVEGEQGSLYVWDGNHRLGIACLLGRAAIPAILGEKE